MVLLSFHRINSGLVALGLCLLLGACGGAGESSSGQTSSAAAAQTTSEAEQASSTPSLSVKSSASSTTSIISSQASSSSSVLNTPSSSSSSSAGGVPSTTSSIAASASSSSQAPISQKTTVDLQWEPPQSRENGAYLELDEIGGYQIRYKDPGSNQYTYINIDGNRTTEYVISGQVSGTDYEIAVYDTNGLFSDFVELTPI